MAPNKKADEKDSMPPPPYRTAGEKNLSSRNITDTEGWKSSQKGLKRLWSNYKKILKDRFTRMTRAEQEDLIDKFAVIITMGVTCLVILIFYPVMPRLLRVFLLPTALLSAWWAGRRIVGPVVVDRISHMLNEDDKDTFIEKEER